MVSKSGVHPNSPSSKPPGGNAGNPAFFKKVSPQAITAMAAGCRVKGQSLELWVMDEHRLGLKPIIRRVWAPRGQQPVVKVHPRDQWLYIYAFAQPTTGRSFYLLMPTVSIPAFNIALQEFGRFLGPNDHRQVLLLVDKAGWHTSPKVVCPDALALRFLPAYSPELQPAEH